MKQHISPKQAQTMSEEQFYRLFGDLVPRKDWAHYHHKKVTIGKLMEVLRDYHQLDVYTVDEVWCVQLFDIDTCANDSVSCLYEVHHQELIDVLFSSLLWAMENHDDSTH